MKRGCAVTIDRVGNGFVVKPAVEPHGAFTREEVHVFQKCGAPAPNWTRRRAKAKPDTSTLFGWLSDHFSEPAK